jgi:chromosome segregation ATPase
MADEPATSTQDVNPALLLERAKEVADRFTRQKTYLISLTTRLPLLKSALVYAQKVHTESGEDIARLSKEIPAIESHISKLEVWIATNFDTEDDVAIANALAKRIARLQKEIERKQRELHRVEAGLPDLP